MKKARYDEQVQARMTPATYLLLRKYMKKNGYRTESEAIRTIIAKELCGVNP